MRRSRAACLAAWLARAQASAGVQRGLPCAFVLHAGVQATCWPARRARQAAMFDGCPCMFRPRPAVEAHQEGGHCGQVRNSLWCESPEGDQEDGGQPALALLLQLLRQGASFGRELSTRRPPCVVHERCRSRSAGRGSRTTRGQVSAATPAPAAAMSPTASAAAPLHGARDSLAAGARAACAAQA